MKTITRPVIKRYHSPNALYKPLISIKADQGVTLAELVKSSASQADVQRFEPHLGHNCLISAITDRVLVQALWAPSGTNHKATLAFSLRGWLGLYTKVEYLQSLPEETIFV